MLYANEILFRRSSPVGGGNGFVRELFFVCFYRLQEKKKNEKKADAEKKKADAHDNNN